MTHRTFSRGEFLALSGLLAGTSLLPRGADAATPKPVSSPSPKAASTTGAKAAPPPGPSREETEKLRRSCRASLPIGFSLDDGSELIRIGEWMKRQGVQGDLYGGSDFIQAFEQRIARLLGFEDGCYMPTGTMGQLITLRMYADASGNRNVGVHPSSHHVLHEDDSYSVLHGLRAVQLSPWSRPVLAGDVAEAREPLGVVSVELPVRWLGGQLALEAEREQPEGEEVDGLDEEEHGAAEGQAMRLLLEEDVAANDDGEAEGHHPEGDAERGAGGEQGHGLSGGERGHEQQRGEEPRGPLQGERVDGDSEHQGMGRAEREPPYAEPRPGQGHEQGEDEEISAEQVGSAGDAVLMERHPGAHLQSEAHGRDSQGLRRARRRSASALA